MSIYASARATPSFLVHKMGVVLLITTLVAYWGWLLKAKS